MAHGSRGEEQYLLDTIADFRTRMSELERLREAVRLAEAGAKALPSKEPLRRTVDFKGRRTFCEVRLRNKCVYYSHPSRYSFLRSSACTSSSLHPIASAISVRDASNTIMAAINFSFRLSTSVSATRRLDRARNSAKGE